MEQITIKMICTVTRKYVTNLNEVELTHVGMSSSSRTISSSRR